MPSSLIRPVDNLERYNVTRSNLNIYNNVVVGTRIKLQHTGPVLPGAIAKGCGTPQEWASFLAEPLTALMDQHPTLTAVLGSHLTANPVFLRLEKVDLERTIRVMTIQDSSQAGKVIEEEHNLPFDLADQENPLWRLVIARLQNKENEFYLLFVFHHVIGDGRSAMALTEQLLERLNLQGTSPYTSAKTCVTITSNRPIPPSMEARVDCSPSIRTLLYEASRAILLPAFLKKALETKYWAGEVDSTLDEPNVTQLGLLRFTPEETSQIIRAAKARGTTVQSILYTASVFATKAVFMSGSLAESGQGQRQQEQNQLQDNEGEAIVFATPVSLRALIPIPIEDGEQGNYTSEIIHDNIRIGQDSSYWEMTRTYREQVVQGTTTKRGLQDLLEHFGMLKLLPKKDGAWEEFMKSKVRKDQHGRKASVKLSNLGRGWIEATEATNPMFVVQEGIFSQSSGVTASALTMSVATANGVLTASTTWQKAGFHGRAQGDLWVSEFRRILLEAVQPERTEYLFREAKVCRVEL